MKKRFLLPETDWEPLIARRNKFKRKVPMTVCIAAICDNNTTILGACDRMMTSGDVEFEPALDSLTPPAFPERVGCSWPYSQCKDFLID